VQVAAEKEILLVGNPNAGKTLLFNRLTGLHGKVGNYPGVTVECRRGQIDLKNHPRASLVDLPGTYSLCPRSDDEKLTIDSIEQVLQKHHGPRLVVVVVDATHLERNLYLVSQLLEAKVQFLIAMTMMDAARAEGILVHTEVLSERIGVAIVPVCALTNEGIPQLLDAIDECSTTLMGISISTSPEQVRKRYAQVEHWLDGAYQKPPVIETMTDRVDSVALHPVFGPILLLGIFAVMFNALFVWAKPIVETLDLIKGGATTFVLPLFSEGSLLGSLVTDGIIAGVGSVIAFVPLIAILFLFLGILEDSGYLARATFLLDRVMSRVGLPGRAFVPLLSGFACAVPAIMSTRVIESRRERLLTMMVTPLMSCSARLPVYGLLIAVVFSSAPPIWGLVEVGSVVMFAMYAIGIVVALLIAFLLKRFLLKGESPALILELPPYRLPRMSSLLRGVLLRVQVFLREAGTVILAMTIILWALFTFPRHNDLSPAEQMKASYAGRFGQLIEPVIAPLGFDWKIGVGLVASFAAREVLVSTLGVVYGLRQHGEDAPVPLQKAMAHDINPRTGKPVYTPLVALSLMVFFALAMQCMSTLAVVRKETKSLRWPVFQFGYMTVIAWLCSFTVFQAGTLLGF